ncbi:MAG: SDR family NAD(P)-dependent oxidoreductase [Acidimicrobiales bacterium]
MTIDLNEALVLVTGAGSGIGRATSLAFAKRGSRVLAVDILPESAEETAKLCAATGTLAQAYECDVADAEAVQALADKVHADHGPLDVLVNNAGVGMTGRFLDTPLDEWRWIRSINLDGVWHGCASFAPPMVERGRGHIVNVSSGLAFTPRATEPAYCTTKAAVLMLSQCQRADWAAKGVGVTAVCPGVINTPIIDSTRFLGAREAQRSRAKKVFNRGHKPELVARAIVNAVERNRAVVAVGGESKAGWTIGRRLPQSIQQFIASREMA